MAAADAIAVDFRPIGDLSGLDAAAIAQAVRRHCPDARPTASNSATSQVTRFAVVAQLGDLVLTPRPDGLVAVGELLGDYRWASTPVVEGHHHCRDVRWVGAVDRDALDQAALGWYGTVRPVDADTEKLIAAAIPSNPPAPRAPYRSVSAPA